MPIIQEGCRFCEALPKPKSAFDASQLIAGGDIAIKPARGMLIPGYLLAVTKNHFTSFAGLSKSRLEQVGNSLDELEAQLAQQFGEYFRYESSSGTPDPSWDPRLSIDHAHQHLVPATDVGSNMLDMLPWKQVDSYEDIAAYAKRPYAYLGMAGLHHAMVEPNLPSQWMRKRLADIRRLPNWDWELYPGHTELNETLAKLKTAGLLGQLTTSAAKFMTQ